jgi:hypothetical protein
VTEFRNKQIEDSIICKKLSLNLLTLGHLVVVALKHIWMVCFFNRDSFQWEYLMDKFIWMNWCFFFVSSWGRVITHHLNFTSNSNGMLINSLKPGNAAWCFSCGMTCLNCSTWWYTHLCISTEVSYNLPNKIIQSFSIHLQNSKCQFDFSDNNILPTPHAFKPDKKIVQPFYERNQQTLTCQKNLWLPNNVELWVPWKLGHKAMSTSLTTW